MKIGIFGGTFNPIHEGHLRMIKKVKDKLELDVVYFVPSYMTPDKQFEVERIDPKHRLEMTKLAVKGAKVSWLRVSDFEHKQKKVSYTYRTIEYFVSRFPRDELYWIMGEDRYKGFDSWRNSSYIKEKTNVVIYRRNEQINPELKKDKDIIYLPEQFYDYSSTQVLNDLRWDFVPDSVKQYIASNRLYLKTLAFNVLREKRYEHTIAVASHAKRLSVRYRYKNKENAWYAGIIHDLFKLFDEQYLRDYIKKWDVNKEFEVDGIPFPALHGFAAALWMREEYMWDNKELFDAIASHTLSKPNTTKIDKILYVADKVSTDRKGDKVGKLRKLAYVNLDLTYQKILKELVKKLESRELPIHKDTIEAVRENYDPRFKRNKYEFNLKQNKNKTE